MVSEASEGKVRVACDDILKFNLGEAFPKHLKKDWEDGKLKTVSLYPLKTKQICCNSHFS